MNWKTNGKLNTSNHSPIKADGVVDLQRKKGCDKMEDLFREWADLHDKYNYGAVIKDGVPFPEIYNNEKCKVLFILKEPHDEESKNLDQIKFYKEFALGLTDDDCKGLISKIGLIHNKIWNSGGDVRDSIKKIAFMNLKKSGGGSSCNNVRLRTYVKNSRELIKRQINEINPDYIVCLGSFDFLVRDVILPCEHERRWRKNNISIVNDVCSYRRKSDHTEDYMNYSIIFNMYHPSMRGISVNDYIKNCKEKYDAVMYNIK